MFEKARNQNLYCKKISVPEIIHFKYYLALISIATKLILPRCKESEVVNSDKL